MSYLMCKKCNNIFGNSHYPDWVNQECPKCKKVEQPCLAEKAYKNAQGHLGNSNPVICISCPCPKCSPYCM